MLSQPKHLGSWPSSLLYLRALYTRIVQRFRAINLSFSFSMALNGPAIILALFGSRCPLTRTLVIKSAFNRQRQARRKQQTGDYNMCVFDSVLREMQCSLNRNSYFLHVRVPGSGQLIHGLRDRCLSKTVLSDAVLSKTFFSGFSVNKICSTDFGFLHAM